MRVKILLHVPLYCMYPQGLFATFVLLIIHFVCTLFCITIFSQFLLGVTVAPRQIEAQACAKFLGANKMHYGQCESGEWILYTQCQIPRETVSFVFPRVIRTRGRTKLTGFPEGPDIKCFVIFLDFHFNSNKRITGENQNSRLGTYNNTNLILKTTEWMIYKVLSLYYLHLFPPLAAVSLLGWL